MCLTLSRLSQPLYPGCSLCEGLEEKLRACLDAAAFRPSGALRRSALELRAVDPDAPPGSEDAALALQVPLLRRRGRDGHETPLPRPPPRTPAAKLAQQLESWLAEFGDGGGDADGAAASSAAAAAPWEAVQGVAWDAKRH